MFTKSAAFYDAIYGAQGKDYAAEAAWLRAAIGRAYAGTPRVLDVACGTGSHLRYMQDGFAVEGVDADPAMLAIARERLAGVPLHVGRMQELTVREPFDALVCLFSSIGYVADAAELDATIARFAAAVRAGGTVIVEPWIAPDDWRDRLLSAVFVDEPDLKIARVSESERYETTSIVRFTYLVAEPGGTSTFTESHVLQLFDDAAYRHAFTAAGLSVRNERTDIFTRGLYIGTKP